MEFLIAFFCLLVFTINSLPLMVYLILHPLFKIYHSKFTGVGDASIVKAESNSMASPQFFYDRICHGKPGILQTCGSINNLLKKEN